MAPSLLKIFVLFFFISPSLTAQSLDTLPEFPTMKPGNKWIELGIGSSVGSYTKTRYFGRNGPEPISEKIKNRSINFDGSYNWGLKRGRIGIGFRSAFGSVIMTEKINNNNGFNFTAVGGYAVMEGSIVGIKYGILHLSYPFDPSYIYKEDFYRILNIRLGKIRSYYVDLIMNDAIGLGLFPEPLFSFGFFNFGFNDQSGMRKLRLAISASEEADHSPLGSIGFQHPVSKAPLLLAGTIHIGRQFFLTSLGLRYRFDMSWK
ncbi:MAG: hypothetical protein AAFZ15_10275 [Bacteroidota bacterium]